MKCMRCNTENGLDAKFCRNCGAPLTAPPQQPGATPVGGGQEASSAKPGFSLAAAWISAMLLVSIAGSLYVGYSIYEDWNRTDDRKVLEDEAERTESKRRAENAQKEPLAAEQQQAVERERQKRQEAEEQLAKLARDREEAEAKRKRAEAAAKQAEERMRKIEAKAAREEAKVAQARARQTESARPTSATSSAAADQSPSQASPPVQASAPAAQPAPVQAANDPCAGLPGLKRELCASCNRHSGLRKLMCEERARERYCDGKWGRAEAPDCVRNR